MRRPSFGDSASGVTTEHHIAGPPGTGKTTYVAARCREEVKRYGATGVLVTSLTKAAASEAGGRETGLLDTQIGTLHAHAFRSLPGAAIVKKEHYADWNAANPNLTLTGGKDTINLGREARARGDDVRETANLHRHRMVPSDVWPDHVRRFHERWQDFKAEREVLGFTDLIELANTSVPLAPGDPDVIIADEAQDLSKLECSLLRRWASSCKALILVGDPDQALYGWRGSDPNILSGAEVPERLARSWRVPSRIHAEAQRLIRRCRFREDIDYIPVREGGEVLRGGTYRNNRWLLPHIEAAIEGERSIMLLTTTEHMLGPIIKLLRQEGIPYHNPFNTRWNPLSQGVTVEKLLILAKPMTQWTIGDLKAVATIVRSGPVLHRHAKTRLKSISEDHDHVLARGEALLTTMLTDEALDNMHDLDWVVSHMLSDAQKSIKYPLAIYRRRGREALTSQPRVIVGTIHSVKGGEADDVVVFPDISRAAYDQSLKRSWDGADALYRTFYVAFTRARERLIIGRAGTNMKVSL
jgi:superfamily I DNA/RNA helicase